MITTHEKTAPVFLLSNTSCESCGTSEGHSPECAYRIAWSINPHMKVGSSVFEEAAREHRYFEKTLQEAGAEVLRVPFVHGAYDSVFVKDNALLSSDSRRMAFLTRPRHVERKSEQRKRRRDIEALGFSIVGEASMDFEGGDLIVLPRGDKALMGCGFRSNPRARHEVAAFLDREVICLDLVDPRFYHLDTALAFATHGENLIAYAYEGAFTRESWKTLPHLPEVEKLVSVSEAEAMKFGLNWIEVNDTIVIGSHVPEIISSLESYGKKVKVAPLRQFQLSGGSAACLATRVHGSLAD